MNGKQLRNSILQWAIQGKLVPQNPDDEPASVLLEKIRAEKARLVKEGKLKKDKNESIIYRGEDNSHYEKFLATGVVRCIDDEIPFEIPKGWEWCRIKEIAQINPKNECSDNTVSAFIPMEQIGAGYSSEYTFDKVKWGDIKRNFVHFADGDIAFAKITPCFQNRKSVIFDNLPNGLGAGTSELKVIRLYGEHINRWFLLYFLKSPYFVDNATFKGTANQQRIISGYLENKLIPIPPLSEQIRVVEKITKLMSVGNEYDRTQNNLDKLNAEIKGKLKKSILQEAIQGHLVPQIEEEGTAQELLEQIREEKKRLVKGGKLKKSALSESVIFKGDDNRYYEQIGKETVPIETDCDFPSNWQIARLSNVCALIDGEKCAGKRICIDAKYLRGKSAGDYINEGRFVHKNDQIILVDGENSGEVFTVPCDGYMGSTFKQLLVSERMSLQYVQHFISFYKDILRNSKKGAAIPHLNKEIFYTLVIGIPPKQEQERIVNRIEQLLQLLK